MYTPDIHYLARGTVIPKDIDEVNKRAVCECDGFVYYESIKREVNKRLKFDSRCDTRLKVEAEGCTHLTYTM